MQGQAMIRLVLEGCQAGRTPMGLQCSGTGAHQEGEVLQVEQSAVSMGAFCRVTTLCPTFLEPPPLQEQ